MYLLEISVVLIVLVIVVVLVIVEVVVLVVIVEVVVLVVVEVVDISIEKSQIKTQYCDGFKNIKKYYSEIVKVVYSMLIKVVKQGVSNCCMLYL